MKKGIYVLSVFMLLLSCSSKDLQEKDAQSTVMKIINKDNRVSLVEWQGLVKTSENEMKGRAKVKCEFGMTQSPTVEFFFHKSADNGWVLDQMQGISGIVTQGVGDWTRQSVFEKVTQ